MFSINIADIHKVKMRGTKNVFSYNTGDGREINSFLCLHLISPVFPTQLPAVCGEADRPMSVVAGRGRRYYTTPPRTRVALTTAIHALYSQCCVQTHNHNVRADCDHANKPF